jgi:hypothetical protein
MAQILTDMDQSNLSDVQRRLLYRSSNGDTWLLLKDGAGEIAVEHQPAIESGGESSVVDICEFLQARPRGPQHDELLRLLGTLIGMAEAGEETS